MGRVCRHSAILVKWYFSGVWIKEYSKKIAPGTPQMVQLEYRGVSVELTTCSTRWLTHTVYEMKGGFALGWMAPFHCLRVRGGVMIRVYKI